MWQKDQQSVRWAFSQNVKWKHFFSIKMRGTKKLCKTWMDYQFCSVISSVKERNLRVLLILFTSQVSSRYKFMVTEIIFSFLILIGLVGIITYLVSKMFQWDYNKQLFFFFFKSSVSQGDPKRLRRRPLRRHLLR